MASQKFNPGYRSDLGADHHKEALGVAETSDPVIIGARWRNVSVGIAPNGGSGKVQFTLDTVAAVEAGSADWYDWSSGDVDSPGAGEVLGGPVTAVRGAMNSGASGNWFVLADVNR